MLCKKGVFAEMLHLQLIYHIPESDIRFFPQLRPLIPIEFPRPIDLEAGDTDKRKDHQRRRQWKYHTNPLGHAANIRGRTTGKLRLTLINLKPALINIRAR